MAKIDDTQSQSATPDDALPASWKVAEAETVLRSEELFASKTEIVIVHNGERYRLRLTRRGKLILQK